MSAARRLPLLVALAVFGLARAQAAPDDELPLVELPIKVVSEARQAGDARAQVQIYSADEARSRAALAAVFAEIERVLRLLSESQPGSEVSRVNRGAGRGPVSVSPETSAVLARVRGLSTVTGGAVALTAGALAPLWPFGASIALKRPPDPGRIEAALAAVDDTRVGLDVGRHTVTLPAGARLETRRFLRGYALSRAFAVLEELRVKNALVFVDGAVAARGSKGGRPWVVGVQDPRAAGYFAALPAADEAVVTRGDHESFFELDGARYHDVLDPRTGMPAVASRSATVIAADPVLADVLAAALVVLGGEVGLRLVEGMPGVQAVVVGARNEVAVSAGLRERLRVLRPPSD